MIWLCVISEITHFALVNGWAGRAGGRRRRNPAAQGFETGFQPRRPGA